MARFVADLIGKYNYIDTGIVTDIQRYKKTPENRDDTSRPDYKVLVTTTSVKQLSARVSSQVAGQVYRGDNELLDSATSSYGHLSFPNIGDRVILVYPLGNQNNAIIIGRYFGDTTTNDKVPSAEKFQEKDIHISGTERLITAQGDFEFNLEGYTYDDTILQWSTTTTNKQFIVSNKSGSQIQLGADNTLTFKHSSGAGIFIDASGNMVIKGTTIDFQKV